MKIAYFKYLKYVLRHKYYVGVECIKRGLYLAAILHDISKFTPYEFINYAKFFYGKGQKSQTGDTIENEGDKELKNRMEKAWLLHIHRNKHHWNYWISVDKKEEIQIFDMPYKYVIEMICDWEGVGKVLRGKDAKAKDWYERQKHTLLLSKKTRKQVERALKGY